MEYFLDTLAAPRYRKSFKQNHINGFGSAAFLEIFGNGFPIAKDMIENQNIPFCRFQGIWKDSHRFGKKEFDLAIEQGKKLNALAANQSKPVYFSPWCEHGESGNDIKSLLQALKPHTPNLILINSPNKGGPIISGFLNETHGDYMPKGIAWYSADGQSSVDTDIEARKTKARQLGVTHFGFWDANFNLKKEDRDPTKREDRQVKPQWHIYKALAYLANDKGETKLPPNWIYKTHAEQHNNPPSKREHKPLFICPIKDNFLDLVACNGKRVARFPRAGNFTDGRAIYRFDDAYGFQLAQKAKKISGCDVVTIRIGRTNRGAINPGFRHGNFIYK